MKDWMAPNIPLTIAIFTALAAVVVRAAARRPEPGRMAGTKPAPITVTADESQLPTLPGRSAAAVGGAQHIFHELHPQGRNTLCAVCDSQYRSA